MESSPTSSVESSPISSQLREQMQAARAQGKGVVLCGDLNIAWRAADLPWRQALIDTTCLQGPLSIALLSSTTQLATTKLPAVESTSGCAEVSPVAAVDTCRLALAGGGSEGRGKQNCTRELTPPELSREELLLRLRAALTSCKADGDGADGDGSEGHVAEMCRRERVPVHRLEKALENCMPAVER